MVNQLANSSVTPETDVEHWPDLATALIQLQMQWGKISHFYPSGIHSVLMQMRVIQRGIESPQQIAGVRKPKQRPLQALMASSIISKSLMCVLHSLFYLLLPLSALLFLHLTLPRSLLLSFSSTPLSLRGSLLNRSLGRAPTPVPDICLALMPVCLSHISQRKSSTPLICKYPKVPVYSERRRAKTAK